MLMETRGVKRFNGQMQEFHQQFVCYKEQSDKKFKVIEDLIEVAARKMEILKQKKMRRRRSYKFVNPFAQEITSEVRQDIPLHHLRLQFPKWKDNIGVKEWLEDCEQYFDIFQVGEGKKVAIAGMHLEDTAKTWFQTYIDGRKDWNWTEFCSQLEARFGMWENDLVYANFKQLRQLTTVESYYSRFKKSMAQLREKMPSLTEEFFVECFIGGLKGSVKEVLRLVGPLSLEQAYKQAKNFQDQSKKSGGLLSISTR